MIFIIRNTPMFAKAAGAAILACVIAAPIPAMAIDNLSIMAAAAPGGGYDGTARSMQTALQASGLATGIQVENVPGAAGAVGIAQFIEGAHGSGNSLLVIGYGMISSFATSSSVVTLDDITPLARLTGEYSLVVVPADSPFETLDDLIDAMRENIGAVSIAGAPVGGTDHILAGLIADAVGISGRSVNYIAFTGSESVAALVGNQVSAGIGGYSSLIAQVEAGTLRALAISSEEPQPGIDIPTLIEQGVDVTLDNWRGVAVPPGISDEQHQAYLDLISEMVATDDWQTELERNNWADQYMAGAEFEAFVDEEEARTRTVLTSLGLLN